jgi:hypothetical protein
MAIDCQKNINYFLTRDLNRFKIFDYDYRQNSKKNKSQKEGLGVLR